MIARLRQLRGDTAGSAVVEFGILAPTIITLFLGVVQVGMWMQTYNALRSVAAESGRYVAVEYQKSNNISKAGGKNRKKFFTKKANEEHKSYKNKCKNCHFY